MVTRQRESLNTPGNTINISNITAVSSTDNYTETFLQLEEINAMENEAADSKLQLLNHHIHHLLIVPVRRTIIDQPILPIIKSSKRPQSKKCYTA